MMYTTSQLTYNEYMFNITGEDLMFEAEALSPGDICAVRSIGREQGCSRSKLSSGDICAVRSIGREQGCSRSKLSQGDICAVRSMYHN